MKLPERIKQMANQAADSPYILPDWVKKEIDEGTLTPQMLDAVKVGMGICATCKGLGLIGYDVPMNDYRFGKMYPCPNCQYGQDLAQRETEMSLINARLPIEYQRLTFGTWAQLTPKERKGKRKAYAAAKIFVDTPGHNVSMARVYDLCKKPYNAADVVRNSLIFQGEPGLGKTGLAAAIVNYKISRKEPVLYIRTQDLIESLKASFNGDNGDDEDSSKSVMTMVKEHSCLILDEFNLEIDNAWRKEVIENIIRFRHAQRLPTVLTCNADANELERLWGVRTTSVLFAMAHFIRLEGESLRNLNQSVDEVF